jgi:hypothetical protein
MFMVNTYRWDFEAIAALVAPRPLLVSNSYKDTIFPLDGVVRTHDRLKRIYELHNASDKLGLLITEGPHKDTQELQVPAFRWMNRWLKQKDEPITRVADKPLDPKQLKVFAELPSDQRNTAIHDSFVPAATAPPLPKSRSDWETLQADWVAQLKQKSFRGWPERASKPEITLAGSGESGGIRLRVHHYSSEHGVPLTLYEVAATKWGKYSVTDVIVLDQDSWEQIRAELSGAFGDLVPGSNGATAGGQPAKIVEFLKSHDWTRVYVAPRGVGGTRWPGDSKKLVHIQRRFALVGQTWHGMQVWDVCRAIDAIGTLDSVRNTSIRLGGQGVQAGVALYAGIFSPSVAEIHLHRPTTTHRNGPHLLNVLRFLDIPQAVALAFPRKVVIHDSNQADWQWPAEIAKLYESDRNPLVLDSTSE